VTDVGDVGPDSEFTLLGPDGDDEITADAIAEARGTISWEVLQQLGARLTRVYMSASQPVALRPESTIDITTAPGAAIPGY
jgi:alanine racemase